MADPLISDEALAELLTSPEAAQDDAGSVKMRPIGDILKALEFKEKRKRIDPRAVLKSMGFVAVPAGPGGCG